MYRIYGQNKKTGWEEDMKLKIKDMIDLEWLMYKYQLRYAGHCDEPGKYLFYSDTLYINPFNREINIEGRNPEDIIFLYDLIKADLVEKV